MTDDAAARRSVWRGGIVNRCVVKALRGEELTPDDRRDWQDVLQSMPVDSRRLYEAQLANALERGTGTARQGVAA